MRGCAGARSTQARTSPSPQPFTGLGFSRPLIALLSSYLFFCTCLDQAGAGFGLGLALPAGLQALNLLDLSRLDECKVLIWVWLEASSFLQMELWLDASNPERADLSRVWLEASRCLLRWSLGWRPPSSENLQAGASFGFGSGSRPLAFFRSSLEPLSRPGGCD